MSDAPAETQENLFAKPFLEMAARIQANDVASFGGAFLIVLPTEDGQKTADVIRGLMLDMKDSMAVLGVVRANIEEFVADKATSANQGFGRR